MEQLAFARSKISMIFFVTNVVAASLEIKFSVFVVNLPSDQQLPIMKKRSKVKTEILKTIV
ncbi:hypothetical protein M7I_5800 [Glarea lozoyensis 74030]|uniref:Uncharacterized protein n=1 Tax=Glarea lozoyensis (strain ATCC 74030 / MF5533) TaxID=1104152 RepID=H0ESV3_GLAL7|nr:hypothetical protein M7I_5800 [Glarea lozoyensis 74030]